MGEWIDLRTGKVIGNNEEIVETELESLTNEEYFLLHDILDYVMENGYIDFEQYDDVYEEDEAKAEDLTRKDIQSIASKLKMKRY